MFRLLRTISHEIRNPLHGILGNAQALLELLREVEQLAAETAKHVTTVTAVTTDSSDSAACMAKGDSPTVVPLLRRSSSTRADLGTSSSTVDSCIAASSGSSSGSAGARGSNSFSSSTIGLSAAAGVSSSRSSSCGRSSSESRRRSDRQTLRVRGSRSISTPVLHPAAAAAVLMHSASGSLNGNNSSSGSGASHLREALSRSAKVAAAKGMVAEIHECALHQVTVCA
jgi:hypothetical protein